MCHWGQNEIRKLYEFQRSVYLGPQPLMQSHQREVDILDSFWMQRCIQRRVSVWSLFVAFGASVYWSSSEDFSGSAWAQAFVGGSQDFSGKFCSDRVRAVRSYSQ